MKAVRAFFIFLAVISLPLLASAQGVLKLQSMSMLDTVYTAKPDAAGKFVFSHVRADSYQLRLVGTKAYFDAKARSALMTVQTIQFYPLTATETLGNAAASTSMSGNPTTVTLTAEMLLSPVRDNKTREDYYVVIFSGLKTNAPARFEGTITNF